LALAVLGLPFEASPTAPPSQPAVALLEGGAAIRYAYTASPFVVFYQDMAVCGPADASTVL